MKSILLILAHPRLDESRVNCRLAKVASQLEFVTLVDIAEDYPDGVIDVDAQQSLLTQHDIVVFQHPLYWYAMPALGKQWMDTVLTYNWAYGPNGEALKDKLWLSAVSTGGGQRSYAPDGRHRRPTVDYLLPIKHAVELCQMRCLPPFIVNGAHKLAHYPNENLYVAEQYRKLLFDLATGWLPDSSINSIEPEWEVVHGR
ncbi:NAD(P)H-dependent oxidoreductase [Salinibius halmophilus]|uniref:NAD(P)H-dependent oxidoreductase n=1 Tax=Salinibius halmophilus TaxID=1853216 RepID=UPI000E6760E0|nr:NAD(P)H-dependent oxidoreductase [Salinibius halmophilus]